MKYVAKPNLPENSKLVLIGEKYSKLLAEPLENMGITPLFVPDNPCVDTKVSGHVDLSVIHLGANKIVMAPYLKGSSISEQLINLGFEVTFTETLQTKSYPFDSGFNVCIIDNKLIYNPKTAEKTIVDILTKGERCYSINVKQGYSKCSTCVVNENAIITADEGIDRAARRAGIDSLKIAQGYIDLPGYDYGFIGGASFKINKNTIAFTGLLDNHPDKQRIIDFLSLHNVDALYLTDRPIFDIGSAIPILEK